MRAVSVFAFIFAFFALVSSLSAQNGGIEVADMKFCTDVVKRVPVAPAESFSNDLEKVYCYTEILGADAPTTISHVWYFNDNQMAEVPLNIKNSSWRTWSSKRIMKSWTGKWRVEVLSVDGKLLMEKEFVVGKGPEYELNEY